MTATVHLRSAILTGILLAAISSVGPTAASAQPRVESHRGGIGDFSERLIELHPAGVTSIGKRPVAVASSAFLGEPFTGAIVRLSVDAARTSKPNLSGPQSGSRPKVWVRLVEDSASDAGVVDWQPAVMLGDGSSGFVLAAFHSSRVVLSGRVEIALTTDGPDVRILEAAIFDNRNDDDSRTVDWDLSTVDQGASAGLIIPPHLITRADWGASPFRGDPIPLARPSYDRITFHHAACCGAYTYEEGIQEVKGIQVFHQDGRGWSDIGYHFVLDQSGRLYQGRPFMDEGAELDDTPILAQGAHVGGYNTGNIGVSVLGCYHPPEGSGCQDVLSPAAYDSLIVTLAFLSERYEVNPSEIAGHRDFSSTACPGDNNYSLLPQIRRDVAELLITGNAPVGAASLTASSDDDGVVRLHWQFTRDDGIVDYSIERRSSAGSEVVFRSQTVEDLTFIDDHVNTVGPVSYVLQAQNAGGRWETLSVVQVEVIRPEGFALAQSFPNPTTGRTTIRYFLAEEGIATLTMFDANGRRVERLVDSFQSGGRWYTVPLNLDELAPGQYYYRLQVEGFSERVFNETRSLSVVR